MKIKLVLSIFVLTLLATCFEQQHNEQRLMAFYENHSLKPILHTYYNRHFKNSTKFRQFERVLNDLYNSHGDYIDILLTDCDKDTQLKLSTCESMTKTKDNRHITGTIPSSQFRRIGNVQVQSPPQSQSLDGHKTDVYTEEQLYGLLKNLFPNYYVQLNNMEEYQQFLLPYYSPKLIAFLREDDQFPIVLKQIGIANYLKMDFAFITDLTEELISQFKVKEYPSFVIVKYNFNQSKHEHHYYTASELTEQNYGAIKKFVSPFILESPRNDLLFHKIKMPAKSQIITVETEGQLNQQKQRANGWVIIGYSNNGQISQDLQQLHNKYGRYFTYINYVRQSDHNLQLYNKQENFVYPLRDQELKFNTLSFEDFRTNLTIWLTKDLIILGVHQDYAHICGIAQTILFRGQVRCLIIDKDGKQQLQEFMKIDFDVGFIARNYKTYKDGEIQSRQTKGVKLMSDDYQSIYEQLDYITRMKIKDQLDEYLQRPVSQVRNEQSVMDICMHPIKKCLFLITNLGKKDRTFQQYLKEIAFDYMNSLSIYQVDLDSNPELIKAIGGIKDKKADLLAFNPKKNQYTKLNKKVTKNLISQFIKAYLKEDKRLKRQEASNIINIVIRKRNKKSDHNEKDTFEEQL